MFCPAMPSTSPHYIAPHCTALHCTGMYSAAQHCSALTAMTDVSVEQPLASPGSANYNKEDV